MRSQFPVVAGVLAACLAAGCDSGPRTTVVVSFTNNDKLAMNTGEKVWRWATAPARWLISEARAKGVDPCSSPGWACEPPTELSVRIASVYLSYDLNPDGSNATPPSGDQEPTQAVYAPPSCDLRETSPGVFGQPNLATCGLDLGATSSAGAPITSQPGYVDLAQSSSEVAAALGAGKFAVDPGTYKYLRLEVGTNALGMPGNGNPDTLPAGTAMNFRFKSAGMAAPYELRRMAGLDVQLAQPLVIAAGDAVEIELRYTVIPVLVVPESAHFIEPEACTPAAGGKRHCLEVSALNFAPVLRVNGKLVE